MVFVEYVAKPVFFEGFGFSILSLSLTLNVEPVNGYEKCI